MNEKQLESLAKFFGVCSDTSRLQIILLLKQGELCVCDIIEHLQLKQNLVSHHLAVLKNAGIVVVRKDGVRRLYSLTGDYGIMSTEAVEFLSTTIGQHENSYSC